MSQPRRFILWAALFVTFATVTAPASQAPDDASANEAGTQIKLKIPGAKRIDLIRLDSGQYRYVVEWNDGAREQFTPDQFADRVYRERTGRSWLYLLLNITTPFGIAWVVMGLLGQVLFTGRMLVQWLVSERQRRSVVPVAFWWMSLVGASMLLVYFIWRKDIVGVLGQSTGWFIYVRNLILIYRDHQTGPGGDAALGDAEQASA